MTDSADSSVKGAGGAPRATGGHLLERDSDGVWHLTQAGRDYLEAQTVRDRGYTVKMGLVGDALMYRDDMPEVCIGVSHYTSRAAMLAWIASVL